MMLRRSVFRTSQRLFPLRGNFPSFNHKEVFSFEPEHWEVSGAPPETIQSDPTTGWTQESRRVGTIAQKIGMTYEFDDWLEFVPLTALFIPGCQVIETKTEEKHGYTALQVGSGWIHPKNVSKSVIGHLKKNGIAQTKRKIAEFRVTPDALLPSGTEITASHYIVGQRVDVCGTSKGKGFQGPMKRWGFSGGNATHGNSKAHRSHGSMGGCQDPGKVWKGKKMAGRMGGKRVTVKNLQVYKVDPKNNLVFIRGAIPGPSKGWVRLMDAKNKKFEQAPPFPTYFTKPDDDLSEKVLFVPKPADISWEVEDIELRSNVAKDAEKQKLIDARSSQREVKAKRRKEEKKKRKVKNIELKEAKVTARNEVYKKKEENQQKAKEEGTSKKQKRTYDESEFLDV